MDIGLGPQAITLESRYVEHDTPVLLSGIQALVRVLLEQAWLDRAAGVGTGGRVSGYGAPAVGFNYGRAYPAPVYQAYAPYGGWAAVPA